MSPSNKSADEAINEALLEKLRSCVSKPQEADTFRHIAAKIHARVTSSGNHAYTYMYLLSLIFSLFYFATFTIQEITFLHR